VRDGASANGDADAIFDPVVAVLGTHGVPASTIAGMTVFTTQSTFDDVLKIRDVVLPGLPVPAADFTSRPELVFDTDAKLGALLGSNNPHDHVQAIATGYYGSARFQTHDPDGDGALGDLPNPPGFVTCAVTCETTDERFTRDGSGTPIVIDTPQIPFTIVVPKGTPPPGGWPVIIQQHGLGGQRDTVVGFGEADAARGFASIGIDAVAHGYRFFDCKPGATVLAGHRQQLPAGPRSRTASSTKLGARLQRELPHGAARLLPTFHNFVGIGTTSARPRRPDVARAPPARPLDRRRARHDARRRQHLSTWASLGGLMGSGFAPIEPDLKAVL
jgi:hypothetical protein